LAVTCGQEPAVLKESHLTAFSIPLPVACSFCGHPPLLLPPPLACCLGSYPVTAPHRVTPRPPEEHPLVGASTFFFLLICRPWELHTRVRIIFVTLFFDDIPTGPFFESMPSWPMLRPPFHDCAVVLLPLRMLPSPSHSISRDQLTIYFSFTFGDPEMVAVNWILAADISKPPQCTVLAHISFSLLGFPGCGAGLLLMYYRSFPPFPDAFPKVRIYIFTPFVVFS